MILHKVETDTVRRWSNIRSLTLSLVEQCKHSYPGHRALVLGVAHRFYDSITFTAVMSFLF